MVRKLIWLGVLLLVIVSGICWTLQIGPWAVPVEREVSDELLERNRQALESYTPPEALPPWQVEDLLGNGILGRLTFAVYERKGLELATEWGFDPQLELVVNSIDDLGVFAPYAPKQIDRFGWSGTALIQGEFDDLTGDPGEVPGCLVFIHDNGVAAWIHTTDAWLSRQQHEGDWELMEWQFGYSTVGEEVRSIIGFNTKPGENTSGRSIGSFEMRAGIDRVNLRLVYPFDMDSNYLNSRYDIWLNNSRLEELAAKAAAASEPGDQ